MSHEEAKEAAKKAALASKRPQAANIAEWLAAFEVYTRGPIGECEIPRIVEIAIREEEHGVSSADDPARPRPCRHKHLKVA